MKPKLKRLELNGEPLKYRVLFCETPDCVMVGDDHTPWRVVVDDNGQISLECGHCAEPVELSEVVEVCNEGT